MYKLIALLMIWSCTTQRVDRDKKKRKLKGEQRIIYMVSGEGSSWFS